MDEYIVSMLPEEDKIFTAMLCGITYPDADYRIKRSNSQIAVLEYVIDGEGYISTDGKLYHAEKGDTYLLKEGGNYEYYSDEKNPWTKIWLNFHGNSVNSLISVYNADEITLIKNLDIYEEMQKILEICKSREEVNARTELIFHKILRMIYQKETAEEKQHITKEARLIKEYIDGNISEDLSIKKLSALIFRSEAQTIRIFKAAYNITPYDYIIKCRLKNAKLLLANTRLFVKETAERCGFSDEHYFSNIFKAKVGMSPNEYRKIHR